MRPRLFGLKKQLTVFDTEIRKAALGYYYIPSFVKNQYFFKKILLRAKKGYLDRH
jgi:hypothetical protein